MTVKLLRFVFALLLAGSMAHGAFAATTEADLILAADTARTGDTVLAGVRLKMQPDWHTYWFNAGGSGQATTIEWELPPGVTAGEIQWPVPEKLPAEELTTYVYDKEVVLIVPLKIAATVAPGPLNIKAKVSWLECNTQCVFGHADVQATLVIGSEAKPSANAAIIGNWEKKLPAVESNLPAQAWWAASADTNDTRKIVFEWPAAATETENDFYPYASDKFDVLFSVKSLPSAGGKVRIEKTVKKLEGGWPDKISGVLVQKKTGADPVAYLINLPINDSASVLNQGNSAASGKTGSPPLPRQSLWLMLLYAFLGGLILNVMPCVLPVIALKILGFVNQGGNNPRTIRKLGFVYAAGVLVSFLVLAGLVIAVEKAGRHAQVGMQFSDPKFIVAMAVLITLVALNLFGVFEINLSGKVMGAAGQLSAREGTSGAFFNGILATILATPCTAAYLAPALGFAFSQPYQIVVLVLLTVGLGLAAPYVILSCNPAWLRLLPKPGAWMEKFKIAMGFPMLATAVWLCNLAATFYGDRVLWLALFLVLLALAAWIYGEFVQRGRARKGLAATIAVLILTGGYAYAIEGQLHWRSPIQETSTTAGTTNSGGIDWQPWSLASVADARAAGHPVLVDFTAKWCLICQVNRKSSIEIKSVEDKLKELKAVALIADDTKLPEDIGAELNRYSRAGVPLIVVFPAILTAPPIVLPDGLLTPGIVLGALDKAAAK